MLWIPGQEASQYPQFPWTCTPLASVSVEHQGLGSPSMVVHEVTVFPLNVKGKTQAAPLTVLQLDLDFHLWNKKKKKSLKFFTQQLLPEHW